MNAEYSSLKTFKTSITFNGMTENAIVFSNKTMDADITFTKDTSNAYPYFYRVVRLIGDSTHAVIFTGIKKWGASLDFNNTVLNIIIFWYDGVDYWYCIQREAGVGPVSGAPQLATPGSFSSGTPGSTTIPYTWVDVLNEIGYVLELSTSNTFASIPFSYSPAANATSFTATGLSASTVYYARLRAIGDGTSFSNSNNTATISSTTGAALSGNPATLINGASWSPDVPSAYSSNINSINLVNASNHYLNLNSSITLGAQGSLSIFFKRGAGNKILLGLSSADTTYLQVTSTGFYFSAAGANTFFPFTIGESDNTWRNVIVIRSAGNTRIFLDGTESTSGPQAQVGDFIMNQLGNSVSGIGGYNWDGKISEFRYYNSAITLADVSNIVSGITPSTASTVHIKMNDGTGIIATDSTT